MSTTANSDLRLIEHGFPCHQVGAQTRRERSGAIQSPVHRLHVWWARRPLTPSRAAILATLLPHGSDTEGFVRSLGIEKPVVRIGNSDWVLTGKLLDRIVVDTEGNDVLPVDEVVRRAFEKEIARRSKARNIIDRLRSAGPLFATNALLYRWHAETAPLLISELDGQETLRVHRVMADPTHINERLDFAVLREVTDVLGHGIKWDPEDMYGYDMAYRSAPRMNGPRRTVLDPTSGGGSIPFEALRLGHQVIANELNPVASVILHATLDYPARFGPDLADDIREWGHKLLTNMQARMEGLAPFSPLPECEREILCRQTMKCPEIFQQFDVPEYHHTGLLYTRTVTCPHCGGEAPLLNTCWLSKEADDPWGVRVVPQPDKTVRFETYRVKKGRGPNGEDPEPGTVNRGTGQCVHCKQAINGDEIKAQARGESPRGKWRDLLYCVVANRLKPVLDDDGQPVRYATGERKGEVKTRKVRFFRPPNDRDHEALAEAEKRLKAQWPSWEEVGLIPIEALPPGNKTSEPLRYGMNRWCDMFTPRQLLGHVTLIEELNRLKPDILKELGADKGRAVITYLQFAADKSADYNSKQTRWITQRGQVSGTFGRHDFSLKWTFGEMVPHACAAWGLSQVLDAYAGIAELMGPVHERAEADGPLPLQILAGTATHMESVAGKTVDVICMDPPYYDNVQYGELSDYFYVWQKRTLADLYPDIFIRRLVNKQDEAVANPARDGGADNARETYERTMREIFAECSRVLKDDGIMTIMFTHKTQEAWAALTRALIESGWTITSSLPVDSEFANSQHQLDQAAAASSIFIACRKRLLARAEPAVWSGFGGTGVQYRIREAVQQGLKDFAALRLNPVDEMVASYGRALRVLSENWPVFDGEEPVGPVRAMNEASRVVAENQVARITGGQLSVDDLQSESAMALTLFGVFGTAWFAFDEALNLSKSLNIRIENKTAGYAVADGMIGVNVDQGGQRAGGRAEERGYFAPVVRSGSKLRLAMPEERDPKRMEGPQTDWDLLHGLIIAFRKGDVPVARAYLNDRAKGRDDRVLNLLAVWEAEIGDPKLAKEAAAIRFGLKRK